MVSQAQAQETPTVLPILGDKSALLVLGAAIFIIARWALPKLRNGPRNLPMPPGPRGFLLIGNLLDMPKSKEWLTYTEWGKKWGEMKSNI
jgi:hypothetical protein